MDVIGLFWVGLLEGYFKWPFSLRNSFCHVHAPFKKNTKFVCVADYFNFPVIYFLLSVLLPNGGRIFLNQMRTLPHMPQLH